MPAAPPLFPTLRTTRLVLRGLRHDDAAAVTRLASDAGVSRWLTAFSYPYPPGAAATWIADTHKTWAEGIAANFAITGRGTLLGAIELRVYQRHAHAELGYWLGVPYWGKGLAAEAGRAVVAWGFEHYRLQRIFGQYLGDNHASGRVLEKVGMLREGVRRRHVKKGRRWYDAHQFGILKDEVER